MVEINASDYISKKKILQFDKNRSLYLVTYFSKKSFLIEYNYAIYNKNLVAIIQIFDEWHPKLKRLLSPINIILDYKYLKYLLYQNSLVIDKLDKVNFYSDLIYKLYIAIVRLVKSQIL